MIMRLVIRNSVSIVFILSISAAASSGFRLRRAGRRRGAVQGGSTHRLCLIQLDSGHYKTNLVTATMASVTVEA